MCGLFRKQRIGMLCSYFYIGLGEFANAIKCSLEFTMEAFPLGIVRIGRNHNLSAYPQQCPGKRFGNHNFVPGVESPSLFHGDMKGHHGGSGSARQQHRTWLRHISRATWAVNRESDGRSEEHTSELLSRF